MEHLTDNQRINLAKRLLLASLIMMIVIFWLDVNGVGW